jgi:electron transport complex protein RnfE
VSETSVADIWKDGLWRNNAGLVQLLGLCPLLAVSGTIVNALGLGLATTLTLCLSSLTVSLIRKQVTTEIRIPVYVIIIAATVTSVELLMTAFAHELYQTLGIFIPLIVTNCAIIGRAEAFASRNRPLRSLVDGLATGLGFTACLLAVGALREVLGRGTLFANMHLLLGDIGANMTITLIGDYRGFLIAALPPGAFMCLGLLVAGKKFLDSRQQSQLPQPAVTAFEQ